MNVEKIVEDWLKTKGYDGLCEPETGCGCGLDDFAPCGEMTGNCQAAKYRLCKDCAEPDNCENEKAHRGCYRAEEK